MAGGTQHGRGSVVLGRVLGEGEVGNEGAVRVPGCAETSLLVAGSAAIATCTSDGAAASTCKR